MAGCVPGGAEPRLSSSTVDGRFSVSGGAVWRHSNSMPPRPDGVSFHRTGCKRTRVSVGITMPENGTEGADGGSTARRFHAPGSSDWSVRWRAVDGLIRDGGGGTAE